MSNDEARASELRARGLPFHLTLPYGMGQIVEGLTSGANTFLLFYITAIAGLPAGLAGLALAAGLVVDAILDPAIGSASDSTRSRLGRRLPYMLVGLPLISVAILGIFSLPSGLETIPLFALVLMLSILLRVSTSLYLLPYQAVAAELTDDTRSRSALMSWRYGIGMVGSIAAIALGPTLFFTGENGLANRENYGPYAATLATAAIVCGLIACWAVAATRNRQYAATTHAKKMHQRLFSEVAELFRNRSFLALFISCIALFTGISFHQSLGLHIGTFFWHLTSEQTQLLALAVPVGLFAGAPFAPIIFRFFEKRAAMCIGLTAIGLGYILPPSLRLLGLLPLEGQALATLLTGISFVVGLFVSIAAIALAAMLADAADEHEHIFHVRREGLFFAGFLFALKAASGLGNLAGGLVLQAIDFPSGAASADQVVNVPQETFNQLVMWYGPGAGVLVLFGASAILAYRLTVAKHAEIIQDLRRRRSADTAPAIG